MTTRTFRPALAFTLLLWVCPAFAQREGTSYLSWVGPEVSLVSSAEDDSAARPNTPILVGDRIATGPSSRAEAILADGNVLRIDVQTDVRFDRLARTYESEDDRNALYLERGGLSLEHRWTTSREEATRIDTDDATILFPDRGLLRVEAGRRGTEIYVVDGRAEVNARSGRATLRAGQYAFVAGDAELEVDWLDQPRDRFASFVSERRGLASSRAANDSVSSDYGYDYAVADFDRYGSWVSVGGSWGWRPSVSVDWRPYVDGYWRWSPVGLTWVSYEPWGWLPYHYGSWSWDVGFGWYWVPGIRYSPAWVYWSYTPSWVGWCPIGYYGSYYGSRFDRHHGSHHGRWDHRYPHLRGRVDVTRVDPRGWSYVSVSRIGSRFDVRRDVLRHEAVRFRPGERGLVATTPLRIERGRGGSVTTVVQDAVRRVPRTVDADPRGGRDVDDLTPVLRRDGTLGASEGDTLRRSYVTAGQDPSYRSAPAEQLVAPRRDSSAALAAPSRGGDRSLGSTSTPTRSAEPGAAGRSSSPGGTEGWRTGEARGRSSEPATGRSSEAPLRGGFGSRTVRGDDGWRSPGTDSGSGKAPSRTFDVPSRGSSPSTGSSEPPARRSDGEAAPRTEPWRSPESSPRREGSSSPSPETTAPARRSPTTSRTDEGWRGSDVPSRPYDTPRSGASPSRSSSPAPRYTDTPRTAPAPRYDSGPSRSPSSPSRSYEAPTRSYQPPTRSYEPPSRSYSPAPQYSDAPRSAPAPRYDSGPSRPSSPPSRSYDAPSRSAPGPSSSSRSSSAPPSRSGSSSTRSASPRG